MKNIILILGLIGYGAAYNIEHYKNKIFYIKAENAQVIENGHSIVFKTKIHANKAVILNNGKIIVQYKDTLTLLTPDANTLSKVPTGFQPKILIPESSGRNAIIGKPDRHKKTYKIYQVEFSTGKITTIATLDKLHFPGIAPIKRAENLIKNNPDFAEEYFSLVYAYEDFKGGFLRHDTLYLWFAPDYGLHKGRTYAIPIGKKEIITVSKDANALLGYTKGSLAYTRTFDEDASTIEKAVYVLSSGKIKRYPFYFVGTNNVKYGQDRVFAIYRDSLFIINLRQNKYRATCLPGKEAKLKFVTHSGMRAFLTYKKDNINYLALYDIHTNSLHTLYSNFKHDISFLNATYDGEAFVFGHDNLLHIGYTDDYQKPFVIIKAPDTTKHKTIKLSVYSSDAAFVSGIKAVKLDSSVIVNDTTLEISLKDSLNVFTVKATDRANNKRVVKKSVFYKGE